MSQQEMFVRMVGVAYSYKNVLSLFIVLSIFDCK